MCHTYFYKYIERYENCQPSSSNSERTLEILCNAVFIFPNKDKITEFLIEFAKILLKHIYTKRIDNLKVIGVNKDLIKSSTMVY